MGLFHYLLIVKSQNFDLQEMKSFFINAGFDITENSNDYISLIRYSNVGNIEVMINNHIQDFSIRTKIQNPPQIIDQIILILQKFVQITKKIITTYDIQNKQLLEINEVENLRKLFEKKQSELKSYF